MAIAIAEAPTLNVLVILAIEIPISRFKKKGKSRQKFQRGIISNGVNGIILISRDQIPLF